MKKIFLFSVILLAAGCGINSPGTRQPPSVIPPVACTQEAKLCPDGSYVGRTGTNCEFAACPTPAAMHSGIAGVVVIGPTCPVQKIPPDPNCADKPYQATINVKSADGTKQISSFTSGTDGKFSADLSPGTYLLAPASTNKYPRGVEQAVTVQSNKYTQITITFDSGIR